MAGVAKLLLGWYPSAGPVAWLVPVYGFVVGHPGEMLQFPDRLNNVSPFGHVLQLPTADIEWTPLAILTLVAAVLIRAGLAGYRRRDLDLKQPGPAGGTGAYESGPGRPPP